MDFQKEDILSPKLSGNYGNVREVRQQPIIIQNFETLTRNQLPFRRKSLSAANLYLSAASLSRQRAVSDFTPTPFDQDESLLLAPSTLPTHQARDFALPDQDQSVLTPGTMPKYWEDIQKQGTHVDISASQSKLFVDDSHFSKTNSPMVTALPPTSLNTNSPMVTALPPTSLNTNSSITRISHNHHDQSRSLSLKDIALGYSAYNSHKLHTRPSSSKLSNVNIKPTMDPVIAKILYHQSSLPLRELSSVIPYSTLQKLHSTSCRDHADPTRNNVAISCIDGELSEPTVLTFNQERSEGTTDVENMIDTPKRFPSILSENSNTESFELEAVEQTSDAGVNKDVPGKRDRRAGTSKRVTFKLAADADQKGTSYNTDTNVRAKANANVCFTQQQRPTRPTSMTKHRFKGSFCTRGVHAHKSRGSQTISSPASYAVENGRDIRSLFPFSDQKVTMQTDSPTRPHAHFVPLSDYPHTCREAHVSKHTTQKYATPVYQSFENSLEPTNNKVVERILKYSCNEKVVKINYNKYQRSSESGDKFQRPSESGDKYQRSPESGYKYQRPSESGDKYYRSTESGDKYQRSPESGDKYHRSTESGDTYQRSTESGDKYQRSTESGDRYQRSTESGDRYQRSTESGDKYQRSTESGDRYQRSTESGDKYEETRQLTVGSIGGYADSCDVDELVALEQKSRGDLNTDFLLKIYSSSGDLTRRQDMDVVELAGGSAVQEDMPLVENNQPTSIEVEPIDAHGRLNTLQAASGVGHLPSSSRVTAERHLERSGDRETSATSREGESLGKMETGERSMFKVDRRTHERTRLNRQLEQLVIGRLRFQNSPILDRSKSAV